MSGDRNIGVAIGVPEPFGPELQQWRERLGDPNAAAIVPHVTLLPPTDVSADALPAIEEHLRVVAERTAPFTMHLRGSGTFRPVSPVVFVSLVQGISACEALADAVRSGPLDRTTRFPYHPHVTVAHDLPETALDRAFQALATYEATFPVLGFSVFEQTEGGRWRPQRDFMFGSEGLPGPLDYPATSARSGW